MPEVRLLWCNASGGGPVPREALEGKGPRRRLGRRLEEVAKAVGGGYCRLQMPLRLALGVRGTVAGHRPGALEGGGYLPPSQCTPARPTLTGSMPICPWGGMNTHRPRHRVAVCLSLTAGGGGTPSGGRSTL